jgi:uncharacterized SAM-binding protein YcdF (DUF218 family)
MIAPLILALVVVILALRFVRLRRSSRVLLVATVLLTAGIAWGPLADAMLKALEAGFASQALQPWQPRTAIIVLGGGVERGGEPGQLEVFPLVYARVVKGLELYLQCKHAGNTCVLLVSGGDPAKLGSSEAQVYADLLSRLGVDPADLAIEGQSLNTWQNAQFCAAWLLQHHQDQVVLVTSALHLRRATLYFSHFGVRVESVRADYVRASTGLLPQAVNFPLTDLALHEYAGLVRYYVYELFGWNIQAQHPGAL